MGGAYTSVYCFSCIAEIEDSASGRFCWRLERHSADSRFGLVAGSRCHQLRFPVDALLGYELDIDLITGWYLAFLYPPHLLITGFWELTELQRRASTVLDDFIAGSKSRRTDREGERNGDKHW